MVTAGFYSGNYFSVLGVRPLLGRTFSPADDKPARMPWAADELFVLRPSSFPRIPLSWVRPLCEGFLVTVIGRDSAGYTACIRRGSHPISSFRWSGFRIPVE